MASRKKRKVGSASSSPHSGQEGKSPSPPADTKGGTKRVKVEAAATSGGPTQVSRLSAAHPVWPAPAATIGKAADFIQRAAQSGERILLVPDKDADGLSAGLIVKRTLIHLGAPAASIVQHHIPSGQNPGSDDQRRAMEVYEARWIIVLDQGSRAGAALVGGAEKGWKSEAADAVRTMVLDHHYVKDIETEGPEGSLLLNACQFEPVCTSALLAWVVCRPMWDEDASCIDYLAVLGTCGDLSVNVKWDEPWPDLSGEVKRWGKSKLGQAIAMINAPRRTPMHDAVASWTALEASSTPFDILSPTANPSFERLNEARRLVKEETERCTHTPPRFSKDSRVALLTIHSAYQVHPSIATRWSGSLRGAKKLQVVMCANTGFGSLVQPTTKREESSDEQGERYVHFSCRIANAAKARGEEPNIIELLHEYAAMDPTFLSDLKAVGEEQYARGHKEASGGILPASFWERFVSIMQIGVKPSPPLGALPKSPSKKDPDQNNKLTKYFAKASSG